MFRWSQIERSAPAHNVFNRLNALLMRASTTGPFTSWGLLSATATVRRSSSSSPAPVSHKASTGAGGIGSSSSISPPSASAPSPHTPYSQQRSAQLQQHQSSLAQAEPGFQLYPSHFQPSCTIMEFISRFSQLAKGERQSDERVSLAGMRSTGCIMRLY